MTVAPAPRDASVGVIAALCARACADPPSAGEIDRVLYDTPAPAEVVTDPGGGVAAVSSGGHLRLLVVDPAARRRGIGRRLLAEAEALARASGAGELAVSQDPSGYFWPGVDAADTATCCFFEAAGYRRTGCAVNVEIALDRDGQLPPDAGGWALATSGDVPELRTFAIAHHPQWEREVVRAATTSGGPFAVIARDAVGIRAVCVAGLYRDHAVGPVAVRTELVGQGAGRAVLVGALHRLRARGITTADVQWVGPLRPYVAAGGRLGRTFLHYRRTLARGVVAP